MSWETIFDGHVLGDHITVKHFVDDESDDDYSVKVTAKDYSTNSPRVIVSPGAVLIPPPPANANERYTIDYDSIDAMYQNFANDTGRDQSFMDELEKAILNAS